MTRLTLPPKTKRVCIADGCEGLATRRCLCRSHYYRAKRRERAAAKALLPPTPLIVEFESRFIPEPNSGCWIWTASVTSSCYGIVWHKTLGKRGQARAHRVSYQLYRGEIPDGMVVCHKCDNPSCVNPEHLFVGTQLDNILDMRAKGRGARGFALSILMRGERGPRRKLTAAQVESIRQDARTQRTIAADYGVTQSNIGIIKRRQTWRGADE